MDARKNIVPRPIQNLVRGYGISPFSIVYNTIDIMSIVYTNLQVLARRVLQELGGGKQIIDYIRESTEKKAFRHKAHRDFLKVATR